jgi:hypothetical protein
MNTIQAQVGVKHLMAPLVDGKTGEQIRREANSAAPFSARAVRDLRRIHPLLPL